MGLREVKHPVSVVDFSRFDHLNISAITERAPSVPEGAGRAVVLARLRRAPWVPVVDEENRLVRVIREGELFGDEEVFLATSPGPTIHRDATVGEARQLFRRCFAEGLDRGWVPVVDERGRYMGAGVSRRELLSLLNEAVMKPPKMGGLATPLGVYMTSGVYTGGVGWKGLAATGAAFALLVFVLQWVYLALFSLLVSFFPGLMRLDHLTLFTAEMVFTLLAILMVVRLTPLSGYHAAEHMTINAVENGLSITAGNVRRQPRAHVRCGTNLMILIAGAELGWMSLEMMRPYLNVFGEILYLLGWIVLVAVSWKKLGVWIQNHFTTRRPNEKQLESGMRAGQDILDQYYDKPHPPASFWQRVWGSGILQIIGTFAATSALLALVAEAILRLI